MDPGIASSPGGGYTVEPLNADSLKCGYLVILGTSCRNGLIFNRNVLIHTPEKRTPHYSVNRTLCSMLIGITQYNCLCFLAIAAKIVFCNNLFSASLGRPSARHLHAIDSACDFHCGLVECS